MYYLLKNIINLLFQNIIKIYYNILYKIMDFISGENFNEIFPILIYNKRYTQFSNFIKTNKNIIYIDDINTNINDKLNKNNIFYMKFECLAYFITYILPELTKPFIIITHNSDWSSGMNNIILNHQLLVKLYGQNMNVISYKTEGIPIGLENQHWGRTNFEIIQKYKNLNKDKLLYLNFSLKTNKNRKPIMNKLLKKGFKQNEKTTMERIHKRFGFPQICYKPKW